MQPSFKTPEVFYIVAVQFERLGFGSGGDLTADFEDAVDQYADQDDPARVLKVEMSSDNLPISILDVTADADEVIAHRIGEAA